MPQEILGLCHLCGRRGVIEFCEQCDHWFCERCRARWFARGMAFIRRLVGPPAPRCCGPGAMADDP